MNFTEHDFVALLFNLLSRNGITKIDEKALVKKLWYYYQNSENKELYKIADNLDMVTNEKYYTVTQTWNFDFTQDKATTYPPEKED